MPCAIHKTHKCNNIVEHYKILDYELEVMSNCHPKDDIESELQNNSCFNQYSVFRANLLVSQFVKVFILLKKISDGAHYEIFESLR